MGPTIELSMIVKNGGARLRRCLRSAAPWVDRIVVGDTGSTDGSQDLAAEFGAEVTPVPWENDFAKARNRVLALARCDWILVLDSDEMLGSDAQERMRTLIGAAGAEVGGFDMPRWNYLRERASRSAEQAALANPGVLPEARAYPAYALSWNTRLFRRDAEIFFEHCVHETVAGRIDALGFRRPQADFVLHHLGQAEDTEAERRSKCERYHALGLSKLASEPGNARAWFEAGLSTLEHLRQPAEALPYFERACLLEPRGAPGWLFAGICLVRTGRLAEGLERIKRAHGLGLRTPVLFEALGDAHFHAQRYDPAREAYAQAVAGGGISPLIEAKLGACEVCLAARDAAMRERGLRRIQGAVEAAPGFGELLDILTAAALMAGDLPLAAMAARDRLGIGRPDSLQARLAAALEAHLPRAAGEGAAAMLVRR